MYSTWHTTHTHKWKINKKKIETEFQLFKNVFFGFFCFPSINQKRHFSLNGFDGKINRKQKQEEKDEKKRVFNKFKI